MADYRDLAAALGGGYGQDTGGITPDTLATLRNGKTASASDLLGMLKAIGSGSLSNLESLVRGGVAQIPGTAGDLEGLARMGINKAFGAGGVNVSPTPVLPTTTDILGMMPRKTAVRPESAGMEELGGYMAPAFGKVAVKAIKATEGMPVGMSIRSVKAPQQAALDLAQQRAALPIEQGGLGLPANNTPEMRAAAMGVQTDAYHGSKQDITGLFKAGYDDNLAFVTQSPEFASKWIGKGKLQSRIGAEDEIKAAEDLYREIKYRNIDNELLSKLQSEEFNAAYDKMSANARAEQQKEFGLRGNASGIHDTVYPVKVQANKTFNPATDMDVMSDFFKQNDIPPKLQELYAGGNYLMYETKPVVEYLKSKGYDSMRLRESTGDNYPTIAVFNPETVRSRFAAFDPFRKDVATATAMGVALPDLLAAEKEDKQKKLSKALTK